MDRIDTANQYFDNGFNCAQSVAAAFQDKLSLSEEELLKAACPFGSGMGRLQQVCGAVSGAFLVIGLLYGKASKEDNDAREKTYALIRQFHESFTQIHKTTYCCDLIGCNLQTEEGQSHYRQNNLAEHVCRVCVQDSVRILEKLA